MVNLAFLWHMHQPRYRSAVAGGLRLPWVRLHAAAAYHDMALLLERHPKIRATVNLSPSLLDGIHDYLDEGIEDEHERLTLRPPAELSAEERAWLVQHFFSVHWANVLERMPVYRRLLDKRGREAPVAPLRRAELAASFDDAELRDLQLLFNLAWLGAEASKDPALRPLVERATRDEGGFSEEEKRLVIEKQRAILGEVLPAWRRLQARGQVELLVSPYHHPILPLLIDSQFAKRSMREARLPERFCFPADAERQIVLALDRVERELDVRPAGLWPPELAVCPEILPLAARAGIRYLVSDAEILFHSLDDRGSTPGRRRLCQPYRAGALALVFRDASLSDAIAREYASWPDPEAAAADFLQRVRATGASAIVDGGAPPLVTIALDGENPWEAYPRRGADFLEALYRQLAADDSIATTTVGDYLAAHPPTVGIDHLHSGSWIEANFAIWIGDPDKNRAWNLLTRARRRLARAQTAAELPPPELDAILDHLLCAEGSDWFWWMGEPFSSAEELTYEELFRDQLASVYRRLGDRPPADLSRPIAHGAVVETLRAPTALISPQVNGKRTSFFEWRGAGFYRVPGLGSVYQPDALVTGLYWGFDAGRLYLRLDPIEETGRGFGLREAGVSFELSDTERSLTGRVDLAGPALALHARRREGGASELGVIREVAYDDVLELAVPLARLGLQPGDRLGLTVHFERDGQEISRVPRIGVIEVEVPAEDFGD